MAKVKPTEKTLEQFFSDKLAAIHKEDKPVIKTRKDVFSDEHTSVTRESLDYTKYLNELASRVSKNKKPDQPTLFQEFNPKNTIEATTDKINESPQPIIPKTADNDRQQEDPSREIAVYQQIINSLRAEMAEYKSKFNAINPKIMQYEQNINSLRAEIVEYRNRQPQGMAGEITQYQQTINSLRAELAEYRNRMVLMVSERNQQSGVDSLRAELAEYRNRMELMVSERNQQSGVDSLRAELAEYKSKLNAINPKIMQYEQNINSLRAEIVEYRNRMELMVSERNQQSGVDSLRAELAEHRNRVSTTLSRDVPKDEDFSSLGAEISRLKRNLDLIISK